MNITTECRPSRVAEWLVPDDVLLDVAVRDANEAIAKAAAHVAVLHSLDPGPIARALARREKVGPTGIGQGVALPHARIAGIDRPFVLFLRAKDAIDFAAPDARRVRLILMLLVPHDGDPAEHLHVLATAAQTFCEREFRTQLGHVPSASATRAVFVEWVARTEPIAKTAGSPSGVAFTGR